MHQQGQNNLCRGEVSGTISPNTGAGVGVWHLYPKLHTIVSEMKCTICLGLPFSTLAFLFVIFIFEVVSLCCKEGNINIKTIPVLKDFHRVLIKSGWMVDIDAGGY